MTAEGASAGFQINFFDPTIREFVYKEILDYK